MKLPIILSLFIALSCNTSTKKNKVKPTVMIKEALIEEVYLQEPQTKVKTKVIYGYDPLCGWCYGFSGELAIAINFLKDEVDFELVNGGLFAGVRGPKMGYMSAHIRRNMKYVTGRSNKKFGAGFLKLLDDIHYPYNSMKASIAIEVIKDLKPEKVFQLASDIQHDFFYEGKDIQSDEFYLDLIKNYGISTSLFLQKLNSKEYEIKTEQSFTKVQEYGFSGYPASVIVIDNVVKPLTQGYVSAEEFISLIQQQVH